jgi:hypothetical protein
MLTETRVAGQVELHGLMAEFDQPEPLLEAARRAYAAGYRQMDAYAPMPVEGLSEAIGFHSRAVSRIVFWCGLAGACGGFGLCWWMTVIAYPHIVGGRPLNSWPAYIPITFESMVLVACISAVVGMLWLNGLPEPYHPVFNVDRFEHEWESPRLRWNRDHRHGPGPFLFGVFHGCKGVGCATAGGNPHDHVFPARVALG